MSDDNIEEVQQEEVVLISPENDCVLNKYKVAGELASAILTTLLKKCLPGQSVLELCRFGDEQILKDTSNIFKKNKKMKKGIAFPTCVSVNNVVCNFSPIDPDSDYLLLDGDVVKIELGVHIDGFVGLIADTCVVGASKSNPVSGRKADLLLAVHTATDILLKFIEPGISSLEVSKIYKNVLEDFGFFGIDDILSHCLSKFQYEGDKKYIMCPSSPNDSSNLKCTFELYDVICLDVFVSTQENSKPYVKDTRTTVFRKTDNSYIAKFKASKELLKDTILKTSNLPFHIRIAENQTKAKIGVKELVEHGIIFPYEPLTLKESSLCAFMKYTFILTPNGPMKITNSLWDGDLVNSSASLKNPELIEISKRSMKRKFSKNT